MKYQAAQRLHLRNVLFNNPYLVEVRNEFPHDTNRWEEWLKRMKAAIRIAHPQFAYVRDRFHSFDDFAEIVSRVPKGRLAPMQPERSGRGETMSSLRAP
jgi:hypothetical protein